MSTGVDIGTVVQLAVPAAQLVQQAISAIMNHATLSAEEKAKHLADISAALKVDVTDVMRVPIRDPHATAPR